MPRPPRPNPARLTWAERAPGSRGGVPPPPRMLPMLPILLCMPPPPMPPPPMPPPPMPPPLMPLLAYPPLAAPTALCSSA